eukprot:8219112-Prorocentrum_lima.AAC.1
MGGAFLPAHWSDHVVWKCAVLDSSRRHPTLQSLSLTHLNKHCCVDVERTASLMVSCSWGSRRQVV